MSLKNFIESVTEAKEWKPPAPETDTVTIEWTDADGVAHRWVNVIRVLTVEERLRRDRLVATFTNGVALSSMPNFDFWYALATIRTLWPKLPEWLDWLVTNDQSTAVAIGEEVDRFEASFRERHCGAREAGKEAVVVSVRASASGA